MIRFYHPRICILEIPGSVIILEHSVHLIQFIVPKQIIKMCFLEVSGMQEEIVITLIVEMFIHSNKHGLKVK